MRLLEALQFPKKLSRASHPYTTLACGPHQYRDLPFFERGISDTSPSTRLNARLSQTNHVPREDSVPFYSVVSAPVTYMQLHDNSTRCFVITVQSYRVPLAAS